MQNLYKDLETLLLKNDTFKSEDGKVLKNKVTELAVSNDKDLITPLLKNAKLKKHFFDEIEKGLLVFDREKFIRFINNKEFLPNSFTAFSNKIGLHNGKEYLNTNDKVSLVWAYKDCVLEGGQDKEDQKRSEIFYNETLAPDEVDRLFEKKVLTNFKKYSKTGSVTPKEITDADNLIIKGNNLLALHSLRKKYAGKVKLIYIDVPYNTGSDGFNYNDRFNHSTWLTFMKNRVSVARELLSNDGAIFVQIDHHEVGYLTVLMDEIFGVENKVQLISVKTASPAGFKTVNPGPIDVTEYVLFYTKQKHTFNFKRGYVASEYDGNYNLFIENPNDKPEKWNLVSVSDVVCGMNDIAIGKTPQATAKNAKAKWGEYWKTIRDQMAADFTLKNADRVVSVRDPHKPTEKFKTALIKSKEKGKKVLVFKKNTIDEETEEKNESYLFNGGVLAFYSNKVQELDGRLTSTILLTDLWNDLSWDGIAKEGGVKLKNGKKPERLIKRIIELATEKGDIVMDYHLGSGTTCAVAHKMERRYIGIEQMDYGENDSVARLKNVIDDDNSGISKIVNWKGGGSFVYAELKKWNQEYIDEIEKANTNKKLLSLYGKMKKESFFRYEVDLSKFDTKEFSKLELEDQKLVLLECLDKNHLYVNYNDIGDATYKVSTEDKKLNKLFYGE